MICICVVRNLINLSIFHPFEVAGRGSDTQPKAGENSNKLSDKGGK